MRQVCVVRNLKHLIIGKDSVTWRRLYLEIKRIKPYRVCQGSWQSSLNFPKPHLGFVEYVNFSCMEQRQVYHKMKDQSWKDQFCHFAILNHIWSKELDLVVSSLSSREHFVSLKWEKNGFQLSVRALLGFCGCGLALPVCMGNHLAPPMMLQGFDFAAESCWREDTVRRKCCSSMN